MRALAGIVLVLLVVAAAKLLPGVADPVTGRGTDRYEIRPGKGIGPVKLGMSRDEARHAMQARGQRVVSLDRGDPRPALAMHGNGFQVYFDAADRVHGVEVMRPYSAALRPGERLPFAAELEDVDVFQTPATDLVALVSRKTRLDPDSHDPGVTFEFPSIGLGFWREGIEHARFFESVYVDRPNG